MVKIDGTDFGEISIDGKTYYSDMIVWWDGKVEYREKSHELDMSELLKLLQRNPEMIVVGTGQNIPGSMKVLPEVLQVLEDKNIEIFKESSPKAIKIFNAMVSDKKRVVAVIHTTC